MLKCISLFFLLCLTSCVSNYDVINRTFCIKPYKVQSNGGENMTSIILEFKDSTFLEKIFTYNVIDTTFERYNQGVFFIDGNEIILNYDNGSQRFKSVKNNKLLDEKGRVYYLQK